MTIKEKKHCLRSGTSNTHFQMIWIKETHRLNNRKRSIASLSIHFDKNSFHGNCNVPARCLMCDYIMMLGMLVHVFHLFMISMSLLSNCSDFFPSSWDKFVSYCLICWAKWLQIWVNRSLFLNLCAAESSQFWWKISQRKVSLTIGIFIRRMQRSQTGLFKLENGNKWMKHDGLQIKWWLTMRSHYKAVAYKFNR